MKAISVCAAVLALSMGLGTSAIAQERDRQDRSSQRNADRRDNRADNRHDRRDQQIDRRQDRREDRRDVRADNRNDRRADRREDRQDNRRHDARGRPFYGPSYQPPARVVQRGHYPQRARGAGPYHNIYRGGHVPPQFRGRSYVVDNWHAHRLSAPPRGYHWVQTGPDYVLAAIATGVILQIFLGN